MTVYAIVRNVDDEIVNMVEWDGGGGWSEPPAHRSEDASGEEWDIGGTLDAELNYTPPS